MNRTFKLGCCCFAMSMACSGTREPAVPAHAKPAITPATTVLAAKKPDAGAAHDAAVPLMAAADKTPTQAADGPAVGDNTASKVLSLDGSVSTSIGGPSSGHVRGAIAIPDRGPGFYHNTTRPPGARFGTIELVQAIVRAAAVVDRDQPGSVLVVNDLGLETGGPITQHGSHQAGRDADILFYSLDEHGQPIPSVGVPIDPQGKGIDFKDLRVREDDQPVSLDVPRTWRFVAALLEDTKIAVQRIFIVEHVRSMLLAEAMRAHAAKATIQRFDDITCQPNAPHDDHLHVRLYCTPEDMGEGCLDSPPIYPWRAQALHALGLKPLMASGRHDKGEREAVAKRTTTPAEARKKAGPMHADVIKFLAEREAWIKKPSPGRRWCP